MSDKAAADHPFDWPSEGGRITDDAHIHALGQMTLLYNYLEETLAWIFIELFPAKKDFAEKLFHDANNRQRVDILREIVLHSEEDVDVRDCILFALRAFDICTDNRNILSHSVLVDTSEPQLSRIRLSKRRSKKLRELVDFDIPLSDLRGVADDIGRIFVFMILLLDFLTDRKDVRRGERMAEENNLLPEKPSQPRKLNPSPPRKSKSD
jgi:hypothetical protein